MKNNFNLTSYKILKHVKYTSFDKNLTFLEDKLCFTPKYYSLSSNGYHNFTDIDIHTVNSTKTNKYIVFIKYVSRNQKLRLIYIPISFHVTCQSIIQIDNICTRIKHKT